MVCDRHLCDLSLNSLIKLGDMGISISRLSKILGYSFAICIGNPRSFHTHAAAKSYVPNATAFH